MTDDRVCLHYRECALIGCGMIVCVHYRECGVLH